MLIGRVDTDAGTLTVRLDDDGGFVPIEDPYAAFAAGRAAQDVGDAVQGTLVAPAMPTVIVGIAQNGPAHASPVQAWLKSPRTVIGPSAHVALRRDAGTTVAEAEVAVVIGRDTTGLTAENAHEYVLGLTAVNDLSSPDRTASDPRNFESKAGVGYTPLGPVIDTAVSIDDDLAMALVVDGVRVAETSAARLPSGIRGTLAYVARWLPLGPGDVVMTGAPFSAAPIAPGAVVEVVVGGMTLRTLTS
ncbi:fumarylacetoacetate hydrolase family protein [Microbacterium sp. HMH0099]|uniref:fumarylacetoacetate hydrolase family protein n=1 Tax=Microbacterium sp. HMH0099 TaxID=3414026 RepID=UPI003BF70F73